MVRSLRWRLQIWHAAILTLVIISLGTFLYWQFEQSILRETDAELMIGARGFEGTLKSFPPMVLDNGWPDRPQDFFQQPPGPSGPPGDGRGPARPRRINRDQLEQMLQPPPNFGRPHRPDELPPYFAIFARNGQRLRSSPREEPIRWQRPNRTVEYRSFDQFRELSLRGPEGSLIVVGQDIRPQFAELQWLATRLVLSGSAVLAVGLLGGWILVGRAIKPLQQIHQTAARINASNLSERIDERAMDLELRDLAAILNSMLARLEASFQKQIRFTADASHELRTPISILTSHAELALSRPRTPAEYQSALSTMLRACHRMNALVADLMVLARADSNKLELHREPIDLRDLAAEAVELFAPLARERGIQLETTGDAAKCSGDRQRLNQVIANLLTNAIQYNRPNGHVEISTISQNGIAILRVIDTGAGIPDQDLAHVFEAFYRVDQHRSRQSGGSGLGLAICQKIIELHGGRISVQSKLNEGSTFQFQIPINAGTCS